MAKHLALVTTSFVEDISENFGFLLFFFFVNMVVVQMAFRLDVIIRRGGCASI